MNIEALTALTPVNQIKFPEVGGITSPATQPGFAAWFDQQLTQVSEKMAVADSGLQQLALGDTSNLHQVMMQFEDAKLSIQLVMQVRNRLLETYQEMMRMQM
ncbi:Flagellar hook-basal body complex protein FliE [Andreprevotia sp. IGB-42]|uniref:flagellar hook-basal body complex protein FliE n=1 Tax=Andreprevotia sp. IGB-42 TaxID=2497473 RepID=UPI0013599982|nr:flagellar hook-basal body complex protein FliE [Andreprevotia sp. IGB-42]KAF0813397.1 Flagellar hook-basal body complex protein FliE [Andreprevotia sp. IGB-42]